MITALAIGEGYELYTPVIRNAHMLSVEEIDSSIKRLLDKAKNNAFAPADMTGGTLTVSNLGMYPVQSFSAIIPPDQVAIVSMGASEHTSVVKSGEIVLRPLAAMTLSVNHRLINGREAAEFLTRVKQCIETV